ncbi:MAG TPA: hydrogenase small subunit [Anaeromyxobacteraceae bacterium]|nr:hydrogenase small subunit [Anaeromyxobacteraceae bacterium]
MTELEARGVSRRDFLKVCTLAAGAVGLPAWAGEMMADKAASSAKPPVIWLHFQECTGCSESLLRASAPDVAELILSLISLDYHETLMAAAGYQAERSLADSMERNDGKYLVIIEGAIPTKDGGVYCRAAGRTAIETAHKVTARAGAVLAIGSCASWGGIPSADPNPTGAVGASKIVTDRPIVNLPGCPANPYNLLGTVLQYATFGTLPALDELSRPKLAYARVIHEDCPRRPHFDAGRFAHKYGDEGHRAGYCLYKLGCKGPVTHANCSLNHFVDVPGAWPIGIGHPCVGCTEQKIAFRVPLHQTVDVDRPTAPSTYPPIHADHRVVEPLPVGIGSAIVGALAGAGYMATKKLTGNPKKHDPEE